MKLNKTAEEWVATIFPWDLPDVVRATQDIATLHAEIARLQDLLHMASLNDEAMKFCDAWGTPPPPEKD